MTMSTLSQDKPLTNRLVVSFVTYAEESWALLEDLALYDNKSWNDPRDFTKSVKAITLPQDVLSTFDYRLIELKNQVQRLMETHLAPAQPTQVNKITTSCKIYSGPHDAQYCMEDPKQAFIEYASSRSDEAEDARLSKFEADFKQQQREMTNKIDTVLKAITDQIAGTLPRDMVKNPKLGTHLVSLVPPSPNAELVFTKEEDGDVMFIEIISKDDNSHKEEPEPGLQEVEYFDTFPTRSGLAYHKYLMCGPIPSIFLWNPIIIEGNPSNLKIPCNIRHVHVEKAYIDLNSPLNIMTYEEKT
ncbi:hypothetical protein Tco_1530554 [Tanacetum coccineum]